MAKLLDTYQQWESDGVLENKLKVIQEMVEKRIPQKVIADKIGLSERTLIKLRRDHPRLAQAWIDYTHRRKSERLLDGDPVVYQDDPRIPNQTIVGRL